MNVERHSDHDPALICRPAGYGLCEPLNVPPAVAPSPPAQAATPVPQSAGGAHHPGPVPSGHPAGREPAAGPGTERPVRYIDGLLDDHGLPVKIGVDYEAVTVTAGSVVIRLGPMTQDFFMRQFFRAIMAAEDQAEPEEAPF